MLKVTDNEVTAQYAAEVSFPCNSVIRVMKGNEQLSMAYFKNRILNGLLPCSINNFRNMSTDYASSDTFTAGGVEKFVLLKCDTAVLGKRFPTFRKIKV
jgi:hypothetical protein